METMLNKNNAPTLNLKCELKYENKTQFPKS